MGVGIVGDYASGHQALGLRGWVQSGRYFFFKVRGKATWLLLSLDGIVEQLNE